VSIATRFEEFLGEVTDPDLEGPELLPARLARASARMLPVDGAGISLSGPDGRRIPLGASSRPAGTAERLQFTVGDGPCLAAQEGREPVFALKDDLCRRWPAFADQLLARTPYRAVVALPLGESIVGHGAIDLFFTRDDAVPALDVFEAMAVGDLVTSVLSDAAVWSTWAPEDGPDFLHSPAARRRAAVWEAMGLVSLALDVEAPVALASLRATATFAGRLVDDVAADLLAERLGIGDLHLPARDHPRS
jgi:hypothetical protein